MGLGCHRGWVCVPMKQPGVAVMLSHGEQELSSEPRLHPAFTQLTHRSLHYYLCKDFHTCNAFCSPSPKHLFQTEALKNKPQKQETPSNRPLKSRGPAKYPHLPKGPSLSSLCSMYRTHTHTHTTRCCADTRSCNDFADNQCD